jgi:light-regulated signal transduction histidine kinase (bacteriophytochrome)
MPEADQPDAVVPQVPDRKRIEEPMDRSMALEVANRELEAFHEALTHGLRRPLLIVTNFSHQLRESLGDSIGEQEAADLERIRAAGQQMMHVIDDLRGLGNVNRVEVSREEVDLSAMGRDIIDDLGAMAPDRVVAFEVEAGIKAFGDPALVKILLTNLLRNAWKFTGPRKDAWIELGVVEDEDDVPIYHVRDNGIGFDNADSEIIFQVFKRLPTSEEFSGSGLGLATVERIVRRHGGRVWADGVPGEGAVVRFTLGSSWAAS